MRGLWPKNLGGSTPLVRTKRDFPLRLGKDERGAEGTQMNSEKESLRLKLGESFITCTWCHEKIWYLGPEQLKEKYSKHLKRCEVRKKQTSLAAALGRLLKKS